MEKEAMEHELQSLNSKVESKDLEVANLDERCSHLVRLGEQKHQVECDQIKLKSGHKNH